MPVPHLQRRAACVAVALMVMSLTVMEEDPERGKAGEDDGDGVFEDGVEGQGDGVGLLEDGEAGSGEHLEGGDAPDNGKGDYGHGEKESKSYAELLRSRKV